GRGSGDRLLQPAVSNPRVRTEHDIEPVKSPEPSMIPIPFEPRLLAVTAAALMLQIAPARAATPVWGSNAGTASGACGAITAPCRTFQQAHDNVATGGTISVLNPGDYGGAGSIGLTLTKSVGITNDGVGEAGIKSNVGGAVNILINAGIGDVISL